MIKKHKRRLESSIVRASLDPAREKEFATLLKPHGCTIRLCKGYWSYWSVESKEGELRQTGFDVDIPRIADFLAKGVPLGGIDLHDFGHLRREQQKDDGQPLCAVCGTPGGLPCPKMLADARRYSIKLDAPDAPHVHPGRCRARLKQWIEAAQKKVTT